MIDMNSERDMFRKIVVMIENIKDREKRRKISQMISNNAFRVRILKNFLNPIILIKTIAISIKRSKSASAPPINLPMITSPLLNGKGRREYSFLFSPVERREAPR